MGPFPAPGRDDAGGVFLHVNTNKRGIVVDDRDVAGADVVRALAALR